MTLADVPAHVAKKVSSCDLIMNVWCMQTPPPVPLARKPAVKLRPFFWNKLPWKPDHIWARVPPGILSEEQLSALEALFPQTAPSPQAKVAARKSEPSCLYVFAATWWQCDCQVHWLLAFAV